jgi:MFS family permease
MLIGFALNGIAQGFIFIPLLPDALEAVFIKEGIIEGENEATDQLISDYGSGLYGTFFSTGQIMAPIVGSAIFESIGYRPTTDLMTAVCLIWCLVFFWFNVGFTIFSKEKKIQEKREQAEKERLMSYKDETELPSPRDADSPNV